MRKLLALGLIKVFWLILGLALLPLNMFFLDFYTLYPCHWPCEKCQQDDPSWLNAMILTDPHLLGKRKGHWLDRFTREWEMSMAFRTAKYLRQPELIIFLGDILDEGLTAEPKEFKGHVERFKTIFPIEEETKKIIIVGNHDIGFHDRVVYLPYLRKRFEQAFNSSLVDAVNVKGVTFVTLNSMAMEGDAGCSLCHEAEIQLKKVANQLKQSGLPTRPILLQHFPLYRLNDENCNEPDSHTGEDKKHRFRPGLESLSPQASEMLLKLFKPRLIFDGHIHAGCVVNHTKYDAQEWTVASFNWRNRRDPNFLLLQVSKDEYLIKKCFLPDEITVVVTTILCLIAAVFTSRFLPRVGAEIKK